MMQPTYSAGIPYFWAKAAKAQMEGGMAEAARVKTEKTLMEVSKRAFTFVEDTNGPALMQVLVEELQAAKARGRGGVDFESLEAAAAAKGLLSDKFFGSSRSGAPATEGGMAKEKKKGGGWLW